MIWYKKLGFFNNPFSIKPGAFSQGMVAYDLDHIFEKIDNAQMLFIEGQYGTGKTTILKNIIGKYRGKNKIIYYSFISGKPFELKKLINGANTFLQKVTGFREKDMILLLDEIEALTKKDAKQIVDQYKNGTFQSIIFVNADHKKVKFPEEIKLYINDNVLETAELSYKEAEELIESRVGEINLFPKNLTKKIFDLSGKNPRRFLAFAEDVARYAVEMDDFRIEDYHVEAVLDSELKKFNKSKNKKIKPKKAVAKKSKKVEKNSSQSKVDESVSVKTKLVEPIDLEAEVKAANEQKDKLDSEKPKRQKKFKVNKLVKNKSDPLGQVEESKKDLVVENSKVSDQTKLETNDEPKIEVKELDDKEVNKKLDKDMPEYEVFVFDN
jgi:hypothetical protein